MTDPKKVFTEAARALRAISEGYPVEAASDQYVIVENPDFREDNGSYPKLVVDMAELREAMKKLNVPFPG